MPYLDLNDVALFYTDDGDGQPVLLVHGWSCDSHDWQYQAPALLDAGYRVISVDLRGHGRSSAPAHGYSLRQFAADLARLLQQRDGAPAIVAGHSLGGAVAIALAVEHPELARAVVPVDAAYGMDRDNVGPLVDVLLPALAGDGCHEAAAPLFDSFYTPNSPANLQTWHRRRMHAMPAHVLHGAFAGLLTDDAQFVFKPEADAYLGRVAQPALIFRAGQQDPAAVAAWELSCFRNPVSRAVAWEGTGHWLHQERPDEFNSILLAWLATLPT